MMKANNEVESRNAASTANQEDLAALVAQRLAVKDSTLEQSVTASAVSSVAVPPPAPTETSPASGDKAYDMGDVAAYEDGTD